jgi:hypothetical protein
MALCALGSLLRVLCVSLLGHSVCSICFANHRSLRCKRFGRTRGLKGKGRSRLAGTALHGLRRTEELVLTDAIQKLHRAVRAARRGGGGRQRGNSDDVASADRGFGRRDPPNTRFLVSRRLTRRKAPLSCRSSDGEFDPLPGDTPRGVPGRLDTTASRSQRASQPTTDHPVNFDETNPRFCPRCSCHRVNRPWLCPGVRRASRFVDFLTTGSASTHLERGPRRRRLNKRCRGNYRLEPRDHQPARCSVGTAHRQAPAQAVHDHEADGQDNTASA